MLGRRPCACSFSHTDSLLSAGQVGMWTRVWTWVWEGTEGERQEGREGPLPDRLRAQMGKWQEVGPLSLFLSPAIIVTPVNLVFCVACALKLTCLPHSHPALTTMLLLGLPSSAVACNLGFYGVPSPLSPTRPCLCFSFLFFFIDFLKYFYFYF